ncbi:DUF4118 domain-containing protein [uncultured Aquincola sp.]|uniref:sensor histidine kinase n=1 Tax=uncultured Aquincola sp. TaxID=886556 RepID=UPI0032B304C4
MVDLPRPSLTLRFIRWTARFHARPLLAYPVAIGAFVLALVARFAVDPMLGNGFPFLTFFPAILLSTVVCGRWPGALCGLLSILAAWYWFIVPRQSFALDGTSALAIGFFLLISVVDIVVIDLLSQVTRQLEQSQERSQALLAQRTTLFQELQHRVANNLTLVGSVLAVQERQLRHNPEATAALREARRRFNLFSHIHRRLHDPAAADQPLAERLREMCNDILQAAEADQVQCQVQAADLVFDIDRTTVLSMIVLEVISNALKHAFEPGAAGRIVVNLQPLDAQQLELAITDNGRGMPEGYDSHRSERLGMKILSGFASSLRGTVELRPGPQGTGTCVRVVFPA